MTKTKGKITYKIVTYHPNSMRKIDTLNAKDAKTAKKIVKEAEESGFDYAIYVYRDGKKWFSHAINCEDIGNLR